MMSQNVPEYFILLEDVDGTTKVRPYVFFGTRTDSVSLLRGDLLIKEHDSKQPDDRKNIALRTWNTPQRHVVCPRQMVGPLTLCQAQLLAAVAHSTDRYDCFTNGIVHQAEEFDRDTKVIVSSQQLQQSVPGVIWYCGPIEKLGNGIWFGVELLVSVYLVWCHRLDYPWKPIASRAAEKGPKGRHVGFKPKEIDF